MKTKPILILLAAVCLLGSAMVLPGCKPKTNEVDEVKAYVARFTVYLQNGPADSLRSYFSVQPQQQFLSRLMGIMGNQTGYNGKDTAIISVRRAATDTIEADLKDPGNYAVRIPLTINNGTATPEQSGILLTVHRSPDGRMVITEMNPRQFMSRYLAIENEKKLQQSAHTEREVQYSALTLRAFKNVEKLRTRYDSVMWFDHVDSTTYYYVIKGKWNDHIYWDEDTAKITHKMGLVGPDLKEIIPPKFDLIHNINGTVEGMVEVEKDGLKGLYNTNGNVVADAVYDEIWPLNDTQENLAVLRKGNNYFYLDKDLHIGASADLKVADILPQVKNYKGRYEMTDSASVNIMECASREDANAVILPPSYLVTWKILPQYVFIVNPLRKYPNGAAVEGDGYYNYYKVKYDEPKTEQGSWLTTAFYAIEEDYIEARSGLYEKKAVLLADNNTNRVMSETLPISRSSEDYDQGLSGQCNDNFIRLVGDSIFEVKITSEFEQPLFNTDTINEAPAYHYLKLKNGKLHKLESQRIFSCSQYVKMNDSYLYGCFVVNGQTRDKMSTAMLQYALNEIYASYMFRFKNNKWNNVFNQRFERFDNELLDKVDKYLTPIDKYNISFLSQKLKQLPDKPKLMAAR